MSNANSTLKLSTKARENFEAMKESIKGVHEVLKIVLNERDFFYKVGMDNLLGIYDNFLQLMMNEYGMINLMKKLRNSQLKIDLYLDDTILKDKYRF